jgi:hypothetical protein
MRPRTLAVLLALGLGYASLSATVLVPAEFKEIVSDAALIVRARVTDVRSVVTETRGVESVATLAVDRTLKGSASEFISVTVPGGTVGRITTRMVGAPVLRVGEQAVFFLKRDDRNAWRPVGLSMGVVQVRGDALTGAPVVAAPVVLGQTADAGPVQRGDARRSTMGIASYESLVRLVMAGQTATASRSAR